MTTERGKTMTKGLLIPFDDTLPVMEVEFNGLDDMYRLIGCDTIDRMVAEDVTFWMDDEGLLRSDAGQRVNARAMELFASLTGHSLQDFSVPLVGNYLLDGPCDDEGNETDVPERIKDFRYTWTTRAGL
ncbi:hypothetical protein SEA_ODYSSEY395_90 [Arthrobacter phage Odyssey395]|nr:hypothetical protein SEA_ODYSSEY395_90 [Arthrobacter phage Odyssey395]